MWLIGAVVCLSAAPRVQLFISTGNGWPRDAQRYHWLLPISRHFQDCKSSSGHEPDSCNQRYSKYPTFTFCLYQMDQHLLALLWPPLVFYVTIPMCIALYRYTPFARFDVNLERILPCYLRRSSHGSRAFIRFVRMCVCVHVSTLKTLEVRIALYGNTRVTVRHFLIREHTCHPTQVNAPPPRYDLLIPEGWKAE